MVTVAVIMSLYVSQTQLHPPLDPQLSHQRRSRGKASLLEMCLSLRSQIRQSQMHRCLLKTLTLHTRLIPHPLPLVHLVLQDHPPHLNQMMEILLQLLLHLLPQHHMPHLRRSQGKASLLGMFLSLRFPVSSPAGPMAAAQADVEEALMLTVGVTPTVSSLGTAAVTWSWSAVLRSVKH